MNWIRIFPSLSEAKRNLQEKNPRLLIVHGARICLALRGNEIFAVQDACTHLGTSLSGGTLNFVGEIVCPLHQYCFELHTGREQAGRSRDLKTFPLKEDESGFFIGI